MAECNLIEELDELIAVTDLETYELLYASQKAKDEFGIHALKEKRCYEVFCKRNQPCGLCKEEAKKGKYTVCNFDETHQQYFMKVKQIIFDDKPARLIMAKKIPGDFPVLGEALQEEMLEVGDDVLNAVDELYQGFRLSKDISHCIQVFLSKSDFQQSLKCVLEYLGEHYQANHCILWEWRLDDTLHITSLWEKFKKSSSNETAPFYNKNEENNKGILINKEISLNSASWKHMFWAEKHGILRDLRQIKKYCRGDYSILLSLGIKNIMLAPLWKNGTLLGFIWVGNIKDNRDDEIFLKGISHLLSVELSAHRTERISYYQKYYDNDFHFRNALYFRKQLDDEVWTGKRNIGLVSVDIVGLRDILYRFGKKTGENVIHSVTENMIQLFGLEHIYHMDLSRFIVVKTDIERSDFEKRVNMLIHRYNSQDYENIKVGYDWCEYNSNIVYMLGRAESIVPLAQLENKSDDRFLYGLENTMPLQLPIKQEMGKVYKEIDLFLTEERRKREREFKFKNLVDDAFDKIYELNVTKDKVTRIYEKEDSDDVYITEFSVQQFLRHISREWAYYADKDDLYTFCKDAIQLQNQMYFDFRHQHNNGGYYWAKLCVMHFIYPWENIGDEVKYLVCVANIDRFVKDKEDAKVGINKFALVAGRMCEFICDIDITTKTYKVLHSTKEDVNYAVSGGDYDAMILYMAEDQIHPDDRREWLDTMLLDNLLQILRSGEKEIEYSFRLRDPKSTDFTWKNGTILYQEQSPNLKESIIVMVHNNALLEKRTKLYAANYGGLSVDADSWPQNKLDSLTGLLNQDSFYATGQKMLKDNPYQSYCVIIMDIDKFKLINNLYGMRKGNIVLEQIAKAIEACLENDGICGRAYADVFYIMLEYEAEEQIILLLQNIMDKLKKCDLGTMLSPCFGMSQGRGAENTIAALCDMAGFAHKYSKVTSGVQWRFYDSSLREKILEEKEIESEMETALQQGQFQLYLQPKYEIKTSQVVGAEALVRWVHPKKGVIMPKQFLPLFEKNGFVLKLDRYMWEQSCIILKRWQDMGRKPVPISVNMSPLHLKEMKFQNIVRDMVHQYKINPKWLQLELAEGLIFENIQMVVNVLAGLQKDGFVINMDDYDGYSSLSMLRDLPVDILKIDGEFINKAMLTEKGKIMMKYIVAMAEDLNMHIVAEGVEDASQEKFLEEIGCKVAQGFYFSRPVTVEEYESRY